MKIYTKKGDAGETGLLGGARVSKTHARIEAYGTLDELNSSIGVALSFLGLPGSAGTEGERAELGLPLAHVQDALFQLGAELATPADRPLSFELVGPAETAALESDIDRWETTLAPLKNFILPGGSPFAAQIQLARTICRRAERMAVALAGEEPIRAEVIAYLNRLSDFLFVLGRRANRVAGIEDIAWFGKTARAKDPTAN